MSGPNALGGVGEMIGEAVSSKKFATAAAALGVSWLSIEKFTDEHPELAFGVVIGAAAVACCYILGQAYVDGQAAKKP